MTTFLGNISVPGTTGGNWVPTGGVAIVAAILIHLGKLRGARVFMWIGVAYTVYFAVYGQVKLAQVNGDGVDATLGIGVFVTGAAFVGAILLLTNAVRARKAIARASALPPAAVFPPPVLKS